MSSETLQQLVERRLRELGTERQPLSAREAARKSRGLVSNETISVILKGKSSGRITDRTATGLARALEVTEVQVYEAARAPRPMSRWVMPDRFDRLDNAQRQLVEDVAAALLTAYENGHEDGRGYSQLPG